MTFDDDKKREIVLDTETTGLDPNTGDRIVEIGAIELIDHLPSGRIFHEYLNPERSMPNEAFRIHGLSDGFLSDKPLFAEIATDFIEFIGDSVLIIHNAPFDIKFLNAELDMIGADKLLMGRVLDSLDLAHRKFPGAPASLDALCKRFAVDARKRTKHGALLDSELLAEVYLNLIGGRQASLGLASNDMPSKRIVRERLPREPRDFAVAADELDAHAAFVATLKDPIWNR